MYVPMKSKQGLMFLDRFAHGGAACGSHNDLGTGVDWFQILIQLRARVKS